MEQEAIVLNQAVTHEFQQGADGYSGAQDTYVAEGRADTNYGGGSELLADGADGSREELIALLKWDVSTIPSPATVISASIEVEVYNRSSKIYNMWEVTSAWDEHVATWARVLPEQTRGLNLGAFTPLVEGTYTIMLNSAGIGLVQSWVNKEDNKGFSIESGGTSNGIDFYSKEYSQQKMRPKLVITYW
jgi:hypothetical protein